MISHGNSSHIRSLNKLHGIMLAPSLGPKYTRKPRCETGRRTLCTISFWVTHMNHPAMRRIRSACVPGRRRIVRWVWARKACTETTTLAAMRSTSHANTDLGTVPRALDLIDRARILAIVHHQRSIGGMQFTPTRSMTMRTILVLAARMVTIQDPVGHTRPIILTDR